MKLDNFFYKTISIFSIEEKEVIQNLNSFQFITTFNFILPTFKTDFHFID